jgi:Hint domain
MPSTPMNHQAARPVALVATLVALLAAVLAGCWVGTSGPPEASGTAGPSGSPAGTLGEPRLKLALIDRFGPLWYCDPDEYPVARTDQLDAARQRWPDVLADSAAFQAITDHLGLAPGGPFTDQQTLDVYRLWKMLNAIALDPVGDGSFRFDYLAQPATQGDQQGMRYTGVVGAGGDLSIDRQVAAGRPMCPICLVRGTLIATPLGPVPVDRLRVGDPVWTLDALGRRVAGTVIATGSTVAPASHLVVQLILADGRSVTASPGHPLADGRALGSIAVGDLVDGSRVISTALLPYGGGETYDLIASGPTGDYLADGIPMGSTLRSR